MSLCNVDTDNWCRLHFILYVGDRKKEEEYEGESMQRTMVKEEYKMRKRDEPENEDTGLMKSTERG